MRRWRSRIAVVCVLAGLVASCTPGPSPRPEIVVNDAPAPSRGPDEQATEVPPLEEMPQDTEWRPCPIEIQTMLDEQPPPEWLGIECQRLNSVLDSPYAPGRGVARVQLLRAGHGAVPIAVVNDIGGLPGTVYAARLAATLPQEFFDTFSLIGMDRRGTGGSAAANCLPQEVRDALLDTDPAGLPIDTWLDSAQTAGQQCSIQLEEQLPALDTWRTAADLDNLRTALGQTRLNGIGHGEGSRVLSVFADRWPDQVGRMVLDGLPDPTQDAAIAQEGVAKGAEAAFDAFAEDCVSRGCELGEDPKQTLLELLGEVRANPLVGVHGEITAGTVLHAVRIGLADRRGWPALATALADAGNGDPTGVAAILEPVRYGSPVRVPTMDGTLVTTCNDTKTRLSPERIEQLGTDWSERFPLFGPLSAQRLAQCGPWTVPNQPLPTPTANGAPPIVVLGTAADAVTPHEGAERAAQQLDSGVFLSWQGSGHGALGFSPCATDAAVGFLTEATVPRDGTVCPP
ncbi:alpha/beta hydrolase [Actinophytocola gossypii]|uniref:Alpha/beta fold hydrolase n=1 Tax=Actinophytocola gossypii TaxID=2812003 RepID=A0ABT2J7U6_9PSEU|nr:alpha/beta hydrolase [Actinophytocola gossypii]MCT2583926.1 alpha/beta fold hydrolase [Actinophytocola gossypii]